jgi:hypothetical protein
MTRRFALELLLSISAVSLGARSARADSPVETDGLGVGPYASMRAVLEKTIFNFDVLDLTVRVDPATATELERIVKGHKYSDRLADQVVAVALRASDALASQKFLRDFEKDDFVRGVQAEVGRAYDARLIDQNEYSTVYWGFPRWFSFLGKRGVKRGDRLFDRGAPTGLHSVYVDKDGKTEMEMTLDGPSHTKTLLATYLAPGNELREPLVRSLFDVAG